MNLFPIGSKTPWTVTKLFSQGIWKLKETETIYLTFDDGPTPGVTEFVLTLLKHFDAKATFFCIGKNIRQHPDIFDKIADEGHAIGNHTMNHISGWKTTAEMYLHEVEECERELNSRLCHNRRKLFRPPYGRITPSQMRELVKTYRIIFWDVLSYDFNEKITGNDVAATVLKHAHGGSIVVFHDSIKAFPRLKVALPRVLEHFCKLNFRFKPIAV
jgi:peptidoglycan/xylan/chitin deacetylase (PgdA/CDA1 family)